MFKKKITVKDDTHPNVPSLFRCPISLEIMKSPVSLCTGVTYDRASIQRWFDNGNNTCPATMQILNNKDLIPNHTLQRLIKIWSESAPIKPQATLNSPITRDQARQLVQQIITGKEYQQNQLAKLNSFAKESDENCRFLLTFSEQLLPHVVTDLGKKIKSKANALVTVTADAAAIEVSLSFIICLTTPRKNRAILAKGGAIRVLSEVLCKRDLNISGTEKVLKLLEMASSCKEGRDEICKDVNCMEGIVKKVLKVSNASTEHAVTIIWSLCCLFRDEKAQAAVIKSCGMTKILLLMQSNCSAAVKQMCSDLLKVFRVNSNNNNGKNNNSNSKNNNNYSSFLSSYDTKTTHIMPF